MSKHLEFFDHDLHLVSEPSPLNLQRFWELDEAPAAYYQNTEGTPEYERRKMVCVRSPQIVYCVLTESRFMTVTQFEQFNSPSTSRGT